MNLTGMISSPSQTVWTLGPLRGVIIGLGTIVILPGNLIELQVGPKVSTS